MRFELAFIDSRCGLCRRHSFLGDSCALRPRLMLKSHRVATCGAMWSGSRRAEPCGAVSHDR
eukprot:6182047-Pleurochrysis_carterae.AAC.1